MSEFEQSIQEFNEKKKELDAQFAELRLQAKAKVTALVKQFDFSADEIFGRSRRGRPSKPRTGQRKDPANETKETA